MIEGRAAWQEDWLSEVAGGGAGPEVAAPQDEELPAPDEFTGPEDEIGSEDQLFVVNAGIAVGYPESQAVAECQRQGIAVQARWLWKGFTRIVVLPF